MSLSASTVKPGSRVIISEVTAKQKAALLVKAIRLSIGPVGKVTQSLPIERPYPVGIVTGKISQTNVDRNLVRAIQAKGCNRKLHWNVTNKTTYGTS